MIYIIFVEFLIYIKNFSLNLIFTNNINFTMYFKYMFNYANKKIKNINLNDY